MRRTAWLLVVVAVLSAASAGAAERFYVGLTAGLFEPYGFADAYDAVYGETLTPIGFELETRLGERWFLALASDFSSADGERVALVPEPVPTGVATELKLNPWRLTFGRVFRAGRPLTVRLGAGATLLSWKETSELESVSGSDLGGHVLLGVRNAFGRFALGAEAVYSTIPDALPEGGAAAQLGEDDLGGLALLATAGWSF